MSDSRLHPQSNVTALAPALLAAFKREGKLWRGKPDLLLREVLEVLGEGRAAEGARKRSAGKPTVSLSQLRKELNL